MTKRKGANPLSAFWKLEHEKVELILFNPSAGIGRQCKLKLCWFYNRERSSRFSDNISLL